MYRFILFRDQAGQWRWRFLAPNNQIVAVSGEGYVNKLDARHGIQLVKTQGSGAPVQEQ